MKIIMINDKTMYMLLKIRRLSFLQKLTLFYFLLIYCYILFILNFFLFNFKLEF